MVTYDSSIRRFFPPTYLRRRLHTTAGRALLRSWDTTKGVAKRDTVVIHAAHFGPRRRLSRLFSEIR